jgi:hypothetical protein
MLLVSLLGLGCGRDEATQQAPVSIPVDVFADTGRAERLRIQPPPRESSATPLVAVWMAQVKPARPEHLEAPLPDPSPLAPEGEFPKPPALEVDPGLKPPILRTPGVLRLPPGASRAWVELDVKVGKDGEVSDALWMAGSSDSALVLAAVRCALGMRFFPALQGGRAVAVWCRQRFDFGAPPDQ